jgi:hypothetical protein
MTCKVAVPVVIISSQAALVNTFIQYPYPCGMPWLHLTWALVKAIHQNRWGMFQSSRVVPGEAAVIERSHCHRVERRLPTLIGRCIIQDGFSSKVTVLSTNGWEVISLCRRSLRPWRPLGDHSQWLHWQMDRILRLLTLIIEREWIAQDNLVAKIDIWWGEVCSNTALWLTSIIFAWFYQIGRWRG